MDNERDAVDTCPTHAAKLYLQGEGPWKLEEIGIADDDYLVQCFARYRDAVREECAKVAENGAVGMSWSASVFDQGAGFERLKVAADIRALAD
jgi:hypothetical protein